MRIDEKTAQILQSLEQNGVCVEKEVHARSVTSVDMVFPHVMILLCLRGTARVMFDMQEFAIEKNDFGILPPGHFLRRISCSDDYTISCVHISAEMFNEVKANTFSHDYDKFNYAPICRLTDVQAQHIMALNVILGAIVATQAKRIMDAHPEQTVKETAYQLGFPTTANFCRYFKRAAGIYPQGYKKRGGTGCSAGLSDLCGTWPGTPIQTSFTT